MKYYRFYVVALGILSLIFFINLIIGQSRGAYGVGIILGLLIIFSVCKSKIMKLSGSITIVLIVLLSIIFKTGVIEKQISNQEAHMV